MLTTIHEDPWNVIMQHITSNSKRLDYLGIGDDSNLTDE